MSDQPFYESKLFLKTYADALNCLSEAAQQESAVTNYQRKMNRMINNVKNNVLKINSESVQKGSNYKNSREDLMNTYSEQLFKKYLDIQNQPYQSLKKNLQSTLDTMQLDFQNRKL